jgi:3'-phosphoadenosine 5'-phosphosulfate sulfotransferase (PAPS reductase)/FAD synthetase
MKILVAFSGGKDSQASLIWAKNKFKNVVAVFCDTGWEHEHTYNHIIDVTNQLEVELVVLKNENYKNGFVDLAKNKKRFPSTKARFCTEQLKSIPMIDYVLSQNENLLIVQGIRADESLSRSKMSPNCLFFKYYFEPYGYDKKGKPKYHTYRKKDVIEWRKKQLCEDILRPVFDWNGQQVMQYILENNQRPNPLYYDDIPRGKVGFSRVGCFPCMMCSLKEIKNIVVSEPKYLDRLRDAEKTVGRSFFPPNYIPQRFQTGFDENSGKRYPLLDDVIKYVSDDPNQTVMFDDEESEQKGCMSFYHICE